MAEYEGACIGRGAPDTFCICACHTDPDAPCDAPFCAPVTAAASDHTRFRHVNRDPDAGKMMSRRGSRSLRRA